MNLFLAMTPAQMMNATVLAGSVLKNEPCDIYITSNLDAYRDKLEQSRLFHAVYGYSLVKDITGRSNALSRAVVRIKNAIDLKEIKQSLPSDPAMYTRVFAAGISLKNYEVYYAIKVKNKDVRFSLYEEGICEYYHLTEKDPLKILFSKIFFHGYYMKDCDSLYVYEPRAVKCKWDNIEVKPIPRFVDDEKKLQVINELFSYRAEECKIFDRKVVFLESSFYTEDHETVQRKILEQTVAKFGLENVVIKMHPRSSADKYGDAYTCVSSSVPLEILAANGAIEDNIFVSMSSSGIINLKLMLDKEPEIFCLNGIYKKEQKEVREVFDRVAALCHKQNFHIFDRFEAFDRFELSAKDSI